MYNYIIHHTNDRKHTNELVQRRRSFGQREPSFDILISKSVQSATTGPCVQSPLIPSFRHASMHILHLSSDLDGMHLFPAGLALEAERLIDAELVEEGVDGEADGDAEDEDQRQNFSGDALDSAANPLGDGVSTLLLLRHRRHLPARRLNPHLRRATHQQLRGALHEQRTARLHSQSARGTESSRHVFVLP